MATEDVIELGSSDEEAELAPKKIPRKNKPNAMVHIPAGVTIMNAKSNANVNPINKLLCEGVTVTKVNKSIGSNKQSSVHKVNLPLPVRNGKSICKSSAQPVYKSTRLPIIHNLRPSSPNIRITPMVRPAFIRPISVSKFANNFNQDNALAGTKSTFIPNAVNDIRPKLPSSITLKKTTPDKKNLGNKSSAAKRPTSTNTANVNKKRKINKVQCGEVMTVDLEDDETPASSTASPQWYLKPEEPNIDESTKETNNTSTNVPSEKDSSKTDITTEEKNNSEPTRFIEITIEDSPIKPVSNKRTHEIGAELAITIDDSPVKPPAAKPTSSSNSDDEIQETDIPSRHSKKKLNYPKDILQNTIEIELEPINSAELEKNTEDTQNIEELSIKNNEIEIIIPDNVIDVLESPAKVMATPPTTPKKDKNTTHARIKPINIDENKEPGEFHPVYQEFIDLCFKLENSNDMQTIVEKKIKNYYKQVPKDYTESEEFLELVQSKIMAMTAGPEKFYLYIKDVVDELNLQRKMAKAKPLLKETNNVEAEKFQYGDESEFDPKRQRQIRKLEKTLKKLHRAIQKLEEQEVDFDDEEDSVYLLTERYKERMVRVHAKFCQLTNTKMPSEPRIQIEPRPGQPNGPAKRLEKWVNKKVPIGTPLPFPDFHDVLRCVRDANEEDKLGWNEADIMEEARDLFTRCGKKLQRRRQENEWRLAASRISAEIDPAEKNDELKKKLETNKQLAAKKETDVFNKYADKQSQLKLEAVEIGDKEAEESPAEEEDDDDVEEVQIVEDVLDDKERRKERIRKILKCKNKKIDKTDGEKISSQDDEANNKMISKDVVECKENDSSELKNDQTNDNMEHDAVAKETNKNDMEVDESNEDKIKDSSDENKVDSDMDELHLLQKLHSDDVNTSTADNTDSESAIDISDTLSSSDNKKTGSDVISIENSSFSESEDKNEETSKDKEMDVDNTEDPKENVPTTVKFDNHDRLSGEIECASTGVQIIKTNNDEYNESVESILLGTSDEDADDNAKTDSPKSNNDECVNLKDDSISIGETVVQATKEDSTNTTNNLAESPPSDAKTIEDSPEIIMDSDNRETTEVIAGSPPCDAKTIQQETLDSDEAKSVDTLDEEKDISVIDVPKETSKVESENNTHESVNDGTRNVKKNYDDDHSQPESNSREIVTEAVTLDDSKISEQIENSPQVKHDSSDAILKLGLNSSSDSVMLDTNKSEAEQKVSDIKIYESCSSFENSSNQEASIKKNSSEPIDNLTTKENSKTAGPINEPAKTSVDALKQCNDDGDDNTESLESVIQDLQSDLAMHDNLATTSVNN